MSMIPMIKMHSCLTKTKTINRVVKECKEAGFEVKKTYNSIIVKDTDQEIYRGLLKGSNVWIVSYHIDYWGDTKDETEA